METQLAGARASVAALNSVSADLAAKVKQATTDKQVLNAKYQKIQDFNKLTVVLYRYITQQFVLLKKRLPFDRICISLVF